MNSPGFPSLDDVYCMYEALASKLTRTHLNLFRVRAFTHSHMIRPHNIEGVRKETWLLNEAEKGLERLGTYS